MQFVSGLKPRLTRDTKVIAREAPAGAHLPYARHLDDVTIETRDGLLMQTIRLGGLLFETETNNISADGGIDRKGNASASAKGELAGSSATLEYQQDSREVTAEYHASKVIQREVQKMERKSNWILEVAGEFFEGLKDLDPFN